MQDSLNYNISRTHELRCVVEFLYVIQVLIWTLYASDIRMYPLFKKFHSIGLKNLKTHLGKGT